MDNDDVLIAHLNELLEHAKTLRDVDIKANVKEADQFKLAIPVRLMVSGQLIEGHMIHQREYYNHVKTILSSNLLTPLIEAAAKRDKEDVRVSLTFLQRKVTTSTLHWTPDDGDEYIYLKDAKILLSEAALPGYLRIAVEYLSSIELVA